MDWAKRVKQFRERSNLKQDALATLLSVSQSTISRIECGALAPAPKLRARLEQLLSEPGNEPFFSRCQILVESSPVVKFMLGLRGGRIVIEAASKPARSLGAPWRDERVGRPVSDGLGAQARDVFERLVAADAFTGAIVNAEAFWTYQREDGAADCWHVVFVPVRDDRGDWHVMGTAAPIEQTTYARCVATHGAAVVVRPVGLEAEDWRAIGTHG
ncbi:MAG: helix-turn-helix domain-containing protein [Oceanicaulis sp.]